MLDFLALILPRGPVLGIDLEALQPPGMRLVDLNLTVPDSKTVPGFCFVI